jgi:hypothetical protein
VAGPKWLSRPAHPAHASHPVWGKVLAVAAKPIGETLSRVQSYTNFGDLQYGKPFSVQKHHTSYPENVSGELSIMTVICSDWRSVIRAKRINGIPPYTRDRIIYGEPHDHCTMAQCNYGVLERYRFSGINRIDSMDRGEDAIVHLSVRFVVDLHCRSHFRLRHHCPAIHTRPR